MTTDRGYPVLLMMTGWTATGKSTTARKLEAGLPRVRRISTAVVRKELGLLPQSLQGGHAYKFDLRDPVFTKQIGPKVYGELARRGGEALAAQENALLDGSYNLRWQRETVYALARETGRPLVIVRCICPDENVIRERLAKREGDLSDPFNEAPSWDTYVSTRDHSDPLEKDPEIAAQRPLVLTFDSCALTLKAEHPEAVAPGVLATLRRLILPEA